MSVRLPVSLRKLIKLLSTDNWHREHCRTAEAENREKSENRSLKRGEFHISHDPSRLISVFSPRWKERSRVSRVILNVLNFKMQLIRGKFQ